MADHRANVYMDEPTGKWVFRASSLARCQQSLVAAAMGLEPLPTPQTLQRAFDEGSAGEDRVLEMFAAGPESGLWHPKSPALQDADPMGKWRWLDPSNIGSYHADGVSYPHVTHAALHDDQFTMEFPVGSAAIVRGHLDGVAEQFSQAVGGKGNGERAVGEAKLLGPDLFKKVVRHGLVKGFEHYALQLSLYMVGTGLPGWFIAGEKVRWDEADPRGLNVPEHLRLDVKSVWVERFDTPPVSLGKIKARVMRLVKAIDAGEIPGCDVNQFPCEYSYLHDGTEVELTGQEAKPEPVALEGDLAVQVADLAYLYHEATRAESAAKKSKTDLKKRLDDALQVGDGDVPAGGWVADRWQITWVREDVPASVVERKAYTKSYPKITEKKVEG